MNKKIHNYELNARFHFRVPNGLRILAEKRADKTGETLSNILREIVSKELGQKQ